MHVIGAGDVSQGLSGRAARQSLAALVGGELRLAAEPERAPRWFAPE